jgi:hypothetical protein
MLNYSSLFLRQGRLSDNRVVWHRFELKFLNRQYILWSHFIAVTWEFTFVYACGFNKVLEHYVHIKGGRIGTKHISTLVLIYVDCKYCKYAIYWQCLLFFALFYSDLILLTNVPVTYKYFYTCIIKYLFCF